MAFIASSITTSDAFASLRRQAVATKQYMQTQKVKMQQSSCDAQVPLSVIQHCGQVIDLMAGWAATPGLAQYARDQVNNQSYDVAAEYTTMRDTIIACRDSLIAMFPKDGGGFILWQTIQPTGVLQNRTFTAAQLAAAVNEMDLVIASVT